MAPHCKPAIGLYYNKNVLSSGCTAGRNSPLQPWHFSHFPTFSSSSVCHFDLSGWLPLYTGSQTPVPSSLVPVPRSPFPVPRSPFPVHRFPFPVPCSPFPDLLFLVINLPINLVKLNFFPLYILTCQVLAKNIR